MTIVASFEGVGSLISQTARYNGLPYKLAIYRVGNRHIEARGSLELASPSTRIAAFFLGGGKGILQLESGESVNVMFTQMDAIGRPNMEFVATGPLPGIE